MDALFEFVALIIQLIAEIVIHIIFGAYVLSYKLFVLIIRRRLDDEEVACRSACDKSQRCQRSKIPDSE